MLTQNSYYQERKSKLRWFVMLSTLPLLGVVTAFGLVSQPEPASVPVKQAVQAIALPEIAPQAASEAHDVFWRSERVQRGDTVADLVRRLNIVDKPAGEFLRRSKRTDSLRKLRVGKEIQAETDALGKFIALRYLDNGGDQVVISRQGDEFTVDIKPAVIETRLVVKSGVITHSLYGATDRAGVPDRVANQIAEVFSGDIDYYQDLRKGDRFTVVYEQTFNNGTLVRSGRVMAAEFVNKKEIYQAVYFQGASEKVGGYYRPDGESLRRAFLRSPIAFSRVSSGFTKRRFHPVLKRWRAHRGVDFASPTGTAIRATGDGVVAKVARERGYGKVVTIKHRRGRYLTLYGHMSRFAKGMKVGKQIEQGDVIGYVGMTGLATGPHLHYEFREKGVHKDPMKLNLPKAEPVARRYKSQFLAHSQQLMARIEFVNSDTAVASLNK